MTARAQTEGIHSRITADGPLTIYTVGELKAAFLDAIPLDGAVELDLSAVSEIDTAGLQLVLASRKRASENGSTLRITKASRAVDELLELFALGASLVGEA